MNENQEYKKKLIKSVKRLQQNDYIYERLLQDRNERLTKVIEAQERNPNEASFVRKTGNQIKEKLSIKLQSISDDLELVNEELDTVLNILDQMKHAKTMEEAETVMEE